MCIALQQQSIDPRLVALLAGSNSFVLLCQWFFRVIHNCSIENPNRFATNICAICSMFVWSGNQFDQYQNTAQKLMQKNAQPTVECLDRDQKRTSGKLALRIQTVFWIFKNILYRFPSRICSQGIQWSHNHSVKTADFEQWKKGPKINLSFC